MFNSKTKFLNNIYIFLKNMILFPFGIFITMSTLLNISIIEKIFSNYLYINYLNSYLKFIINFLFFSFFGILFTVISLFFQKKFLFFWKRIWTNNWWKSFVKETYKKTRCLYCLF